MFVQLFFVTSGHLHTKFCHNWQNVAERYCNVAFLSSDCAPLWICWMSIWASHDEYLVVSIIVHNLVGINGVVFILCINTLAFGLKMPIPAPKMGVWGISPYKWGVATLRPPKRHSLVKTHRMTYRSS